MLAFLPRALQADVASFAQAVRESPAARGTTYFTSNDGDLRIKKGEYGNQERSAFAYTQHEAKKLRSQLRKAGFTLPLDTVEGLLTEALSDLDGASYDNEVGKQTDRRRRWAANRPEGVCQRCPLYMSRPAKPGRTLCEDCLAYLSENVKRSRAKRKATAA
jgi:hypothetical protein